MNINRRIAELVEEMKITISGGGSGKDRAVPKSAQKSGEAEGSAARKMGARERQAYAEFTAAASDGGRALTAHELSALERFRKMDELDAAYRGKRVTEEKSDSQRELDAYRAYELQRQGVDLGTIFKTTGGYRQGVVDARARQSAAAKSQPKAKAKKGKKIDEAISSGDPNRGRLGRKSPLVPRGLMPTDTVDREGKPVKTLGKLHRRLASLGDDARARYRRNYGYRTPVAGRNRRVYPPQ
jgi:hypothetical protein